MIQFEKNYDINDGNGSVTFKKVDDLTVEAVYNRGTIKAKWDGDILKGIYTDKVSNGYGLINFSFNENTFEAKWKAGTEEGPMKGKWKGKLENNRSENSIVWSGKGIEGYKRYISYYLPAEEFDGQNIPKEFYVQLENKYFQELLPDLDVICFDLDNDDSAKNRGGNWVYSIIYHIPSGSLLRYNFWQGETFGEQYFDSKVIVLSDYSKDMGSYRGLWNIKGPVPRNEDNWDIGFTDNNSLRKIENPGVISEELIDRIKNNVNANLIFQFVKDVIELLNSKQ